MRLRAWPPEVGFLLYDRHRSELAPKAGYFGVAHDPPRTQELEAARQKRYGQCSSDGSGEVATSRSMNDAEL
jgi:hypothetical protein